MSIFAFDHQHEQSPSTLSTLLGAKGANLAELTSVLQLPVPLGFTVSTGACQEFLNGGWPAHLDDQIALRIEALEQALGRTFGDVRDPLLVSVRSGAAVAMPGVLASVLNVGLNDESVEGLAVAAGDERFAFDAYRRLIQMFGQIVKGLVADPFDEAFAKAMDRAHVDFEGDVPADLLRYVCSGFKSIYSQHTGEEFPGDPAIQLKMAIEAAFSSWNGPRAIAFRNSEGISHSLGAAVNVQVMVYGNKGNASGTGTASTRSPSSGANEPEGRFRPKVQGKENNAGAQPFESLVEMGRIMPAAHQDLLGVLSTVESHFRDMCDVDFTIDDGKLWILKADAGERSGVAALRMAKEMTADPSIGLSRTEAVDRLTAEHLEQILHPWFEQSDRMVLTRGLAASPGAAIGKVVLTAEAAIAADAEGESVILVCQETSPEDVHAMATAAGILTSRGGLASHAAVVARGWGTPAVCGAEELELAEDHFVVNGLRVDEGDVISLDGSTGEVILGALEMVGVDLPPEFEEILAWADDIRRGKMAVRANADTGEDAAVARGFGAEGIGLCRTEHMFLGEDRLPIVRQMILADTPAREKMALARLRMVQRDDFLEILEAMDALPVTVRLLDPPLHEFLPAIEDLVVKQAESGLDDEETKMLKAARAWHEQNPMMGTRGVRLGYLKPGLYAMQVTALLEAVAERVAAGGEPIVEVMIPLTVTAAELAGARRWVTDVLETHGAAGAEVTIGTMIETPRAALRAGEIAEHADFFSFGTNDLTQLTFGFSRDDVEARIMGLYLEQGLLEGNPFDSIDVAGVGELVRLGAERGRATKPGLKLGVCGEHGGDLASIKVFYDVGIDYVSCSPYRVPIARLAAAQGVIAAEGLG